MSGESNMTNHPVRKASPSEIALVAALPKDHRKDLVAKYKVPKKMRRIDQQAQYVAERMDAAVLKGYADLYLDGNGGTFTWYRFQGKDAPNVAAAVGALKQREPMAFTSTGLKTPLDDAMPKLHRVIEYTGYVIMEYGAKDGQRTVFENYGKHPEPVEHLYRVVLRQQPFSVEVRAGTGPKQERLLEAVQRDLGVKFGEEVPCYVVGTDGCDTLQTPLGARFVKVKFETRGGGTRSIGLEADEENGLETADRYKAELKAGSKELVRGYEYGTLHPTDGYTEQATYEVTLSNGQMRVGARSSERAIENLRQKVVSLFAAPVRAKAS